MPGMYDDVMAGPFEVVEEHKGRGARKRMLRRSMTMGEIRADNADLLDQIAVYAGMVEFLLNKSA